MRRRHVLNQGRDPVGLFVAAMIWGFGDRGYGPWRVARILERAGDVNALASHIGGLAGAARHGPAAAWDAMHGEHKLFGLGPAFATKITYFAAVAEWSGSSQIPLIADLNTSWAMWDLVEVARSVQRRGSYLTYVDLAHRWADVSGCRPDDIERALFEVGKTVQRKQRRWQQTVRVAPAIGR